MNSDVLTSTYSDGGVGDHGPGGIQKFLADHQCQDVCVGLGIETEGCPDEENSDED